MDLEIPPAASFFGARPGSAHDHHRRQQMPRHRPPMSPRRSPIHRYSLSPRRSPPYRRLSLSPRRSPRHPYALPSPPPRRSPDPLNYPISTSFPPLSPTGCRHRRASPPLPREFANEPLFYERFRQEYR